MWGRVCISGMHRRGVGKITLSHGYTDQVVKIRVFGVHLVSVVNKAHLRDGRMCG